MQSLYMRIANAMLFPLALIAALGAIDNSYSYGLLGTLIYGVWAGSIMAELEELGE